MKPLVSVIIASRGRPDGVYRAAASCGVQADIIVGLDDDDAALEQSLQALSALAHVRVIVGPRPKTIGALANDLAAEARGRWLFFLPDDYVINEPGWIERLSGVLLGLPHRIGVLYPDDAMHPNFPTLPILSRRMVQEVGYFLSPYFPFWFADTWWYEIGIMTGLLQPAGFSVSAPDGKGQTHGMKDLEFWVRFFEATRSMRISDAYGLARIAFSDARRERPNNPVVQNICALQVAHLSDPKFLAKWGARGDEAPSSRYADVKTAAEVMMMELRK